MTSGEPLFDRSEEYDAMLMEGLRLTGEGRAFYIRGRLALLRSVLPEGFAPRRVLDFGCGTGETTAALAACFPRARVTGVDNAPQALAHARTRFSNANVEFRLVHELEGNGDFELCYVNGVFHHILPHSRDDAVQQIRRQLVGGGHFALFENNPWNPGTRLVMRRIAFDRNAVLLSPRTARALLRSNGFCVDARTEHIFFFPALLSQLRSLEPRMRRIPFGGQYLVLARRCD